MQRRVATFYQHEQAVASDTWTIVHGLKDYPIVEVFVDVDGTPTKIIPASIVYEDDTTCTVTFTAPYAGIAMVV